MKLLERLDPRHPLGITAANEHITAVFADYLLRHLEKLPDGELFKMPTWRSGIVFLFGRDGLNRETFRRWRSYFHRQFHPGRASSDLGDRWLREHETSFDVVDRG